MKGSYALLDIFMTYIPLKDSEQNFVYKTLFWAFFRNFDEPSVSDTHNTDDYSTLITEYDYCKIIMKYKSQLDPVVVQPCKIWLQSSYEVFQQFSKDFGNVEQFLDFRGLSQNAFSNRQKKHSTTRVHRNTVCAKRAREASKIHLLRVLI